VIRIRNVVFDEKARKYDLKNVDLMQTIKKSMIEMTYETQNLNLIISIIEIDSDEKEILIKKTFDQGIIDQLTDENSEENFMQMIQFMKKEKTSKYLTTSSFSVKTISDSSTKAIHDTEMHEKNSSIKKTMNLDLDSTNILPEKMSRTRGSAHKQAYSIALAHAENANNQAFHAAFASVFLTNIKSRRIHRNDLLEESRFYHQMIKHSHANEFRNIMQMKLEALIDRNT
jgi:hypothetical protein